MYNLISNLEIMAYKSLKKPINGKILTFTAPATLIKGGAVT